MMITTHDLTRSFGPKLAVDRVNITINRGEIYGLIGPNGAGKSTLVALLCTLVTPTSGTATVSGFDIIGDTRRVRDSISLNFGGERSFYWRLNALQNLEFFAAIHGLDRLESRALTRAVLERLGLWEDRNVRFGEFSGGMKKRLNLARALMLDRPVYLCDEPTTGTDPASALRMREVFHELKGKGKTILLVTHNLEEVTELCDRVGMMSRGRMVHEDTPEGMRRLIAPEAIGIELADGRRDMSASLLALPFVRRVQGDGTAYTVYTDAPERDVSALIGWLSREGIPALQVGVVRPRLQDVFVKLVEKEHV
ncbi:MAG TPA: ABC transporter ATP-binding protein [Dehalococcoidia bacterium]|nr:ABC transporter ATP-binding protein [Dehalococcoidia bacterium]